VSKLSEWYDSLPEHTKQYLNRQPIWHDSDLYKSLAIGAVVGFIVGFLVGYEVAWEPVIRTFRPLIG
jgi:ElaB/YqjD/DUF883 family membrane-anchored ribosome-binding protein